MDSDGASENLQFRQTDFSIYQKVLPSNSDSFSQSQCKTQSVSLGKVEFELEDSVSSTEMSLLYAGHISNPLVPVLGFRESRHPWQGN